MQTVPHQNMTDPLHGSVSFQADSDTKHPLLFEFYDSPDESDRLSHHSKEPTVSEGYEQQETRSRYLDKKQVKEEKARRKDNVKRRQLDLFPADVSPIHGSNTHSIDNLVIPPFVLSQPRFQLSKSDHIEPYQPNSKVRGQQKATMRKRMSGQLPANKSFSVSSVRENSKERHSAASQQFAI